MDYSVFERLVAQMNSEERKKLLQNIKVPAYNAASLDVRMESDSPKVENLDTLFRTESFWYRIYLRIIALFSGGTFDAFYKKVLLQRIARRINKKFPHLIDYEKKLFCRELHRQLVVLKTSADYFYHTLTDIETDPGSFYVFLGTFFMPILNERYKGEIHPANIPADAQDLGAVRQEQLKKLDKLLDSVNKAKRDQLGMAIRSLNWIRGFCALPFHSFIGKFAGSNSDECTFAGAAGYLDQFAQHLCNGVYVQEELLKALFLYNSKEESDAPDASAFINNASTHIATIKKFMAVVPLRSMGILAHNSLTWTPDMPEASTDYFPLFRRTWHKIFEKEWSYHLQNQQRRMALAQFKAFAGAEHLPLLPFRPWEKTSADLPFKYDLCLGFLAYFFTTMYDKYSSLLENLLTVGTFPKKEYRANLMDCIDIIQTQRRRLDELIDKLRPLNPLGILFRDACANAAVGAKKLNGLIQKLEDESRPIVTDCKKSAAALSELLSETIQNFGTPASTVILNPSENVADFIRHIDDIRVGMVTVGNILGKLENIAVTSDDEPLSYKTDT